MTTAYEVPLSSKAQEFVISLNGTSYKLTFTWNRALSNWVMNMAKEDGTPVLCGVPMVTGTDLLAQYQYLGIGGALVVQTDYDPAATPTYENLGTDSHLYFVTEA